MQSRSQGWKKGGKARQDANMTNNKPAGNLLIRVSKGASLFSHFSSVGEFEFFQRVGFLTDSTGPSLTHLQFCLDLSQLSPSKYLDVGANLSKSRVNSTKNTSPSKTDAMPVYNSKIVFSQIQLQLVVALSRKIIHPPACVSESSPF